MNMVEKMRKVSGAKNTSSSSFRKSRIEEEFADLST